MAGQQFYYQDIWQDVRLYLADAPTSQEKSLKIMTSLLALCLVAHLPIPFGPAVALNNRLPSPTLCRVKLFSVVFLMFIESLGLVAWYTLPSLNATFSPTAIALDFFFACATGFVVDITAKRPYSWVPASSFLFFGAISSFAKCQSYYQTHLLYFASGNLFAGGCCRLLLLFLQLLPRPSVAKHTHERISPYVSWHEELASLFHSDFFGMFRDFPSPDSVQNLELELNPHDLSEAFSKVWGETDERSKNRFFTVCVKTVSWLLFLGILPRLLTTALLMSQPLLLQRIILFVGIAAPDTETRWTLILSTFVIFFGCSVSRACYHLLSHRMHVALRGALSFQVLRKTHRLGQDQAKSAAVLSLVSEDIPIICTHIQSFYELFNDAIHIVLGVLLLWTVAGPACLISIAMVATTVVVRILLQSSITKAQSDLTELSRNRLEDTRSALSQLPLIQMLGLRSVVVAGLNTLRRTELERSQTLSDKENLSMLADIVVDTVTPNALALGFYLLTPGTVTPEHIFPSLALSVHLQIALYTGMRKYASMEPLFGALKRLESFLLQDEPTDPRAVADLGGGAINCVELAISPQGCKTPILKNMSFSVAKGAVTACIGPSSSGKSTFLQAVAGAATTIEGSLYVSNAKVAYCDQVPYLENVSIQDNIIAGLEFDSERYDLVLRLCLLHHDIAKLDEGDAYITGSNGFNLSRGQRQRIALARALYSRVGTVVIDDLFGSLDRKSATSILFLLCGKHDGFLRREKRTVFLSTYLVDCFDITDQVLIFDGLGNAMLRSSTDVDPEFRNMLENLSSPRELNPEEEDHKQLAGILRSRRIRETLDNAAHHPTTIRPGPLSGILRLSGESPTQWPIVLLLLLNSFLAIVENVTEYLTPTWLDLHPTEIEFPLAFTLISMANIGVNALRSRVVSRILVPSNAKHLDETAIRQLFKSTLAYLGAVDQGKLLQQLNAYIQMAEEIPSRLCYMSYMVFHVFFRTITITSGIKSGLFLLPTIGAFAYAAEEKLGQRILETVNGLKHTRAFGRTRQNLTAAFELVNESQRWYHASLCRRGSMLFICDLHTAISLTAVVILGTYEPLASSQSGIGLSVWSSLCLSHALECLAEQFSLCDILLGNAYDLRDVVQNIPVEDHQSGVDVPASWPERGEVLFENVTARYNAMQASNPALREVSLAVGAGEKLAIAGRTGSGKSSLLLALLGFLQYEGTIKIDGIDISTINRDTLRSRVITLTYDPLQLPDTVRKNLVPFDFQYSASGETCLDDETLCRVLSDLGIWKPISRQGGLGAFLSAITLSRSELQLFGIARAIIQRMGREGRLILMDEATSALDAATDKRIQAALTAAFPRCTFLTITHRQRTIRDAEKFLELQEGAVASFRDARQIREEDAGEARVSYNQLAESAGGGTLHYNPAE